MARAIVLEPKVLLFDEPLSNLDAKLRRRVREDIRALQQSLRLTVVYVTHDQEEALAVSDRIIVMHSARIVQDGTPRDLYERPATRFVADFIGNANLLPGHADRASSDGFARGRARRRRRCACRIAACRTGRRRSPSVRRRSASGRAATSADELGGVVRKAAYLGSHMEYEVALDGLPGEVFVIDQRRRLAARSRARAIGVAIAPGGAVAGAAR